MKTNKNLTDKVDKLFDIVEELYGREICNNCTHFLDKDYVELCDDAVQIIQELKR